MTDDEWLIDQQRLHNQATYRNPTSTRIPHQPYTFTADQIRIALAVYDNLSPERRRSWNAARTRTKENT